MAENFFPRPPSREGHFLLESGYHSDLWFELDALFVDTERIAPLILTLANQLRPYEPTAICGPLLGGAFLALSIARELKLKFYFTRQQPNDEHSVLYQAVYSLSSALDQVIGGERVAVVDDVISAGSSVRATCESLKKSDARIVVIGTLMLLGVAAENHFAQLSIPIAAVSRRDFNLWNPDECPACRARVPLTNPTLNLV
jgi:orotate phosphoribosyltransferase